MAGFRDILSMALGWLSGHAGTLAPGPYRVAAGDVYHAGAAAGQAFVAGARAGDVYHPGAAAGQTRA